MRPAARVAAAIECMDRILVGEPAEKVLTNWARQSRFAGSKDRRAVRDLVFDAIRNKRSYACLGGGETGRQILLGASVQAGTLNELFNGEGYGPKPVSDDERQAFGSLEDASIAVKLDVPDWVLEIAQRDGVTDVEQVFQLYKKRAPVFLRVNLLRASVDKALSALSEDGIYAERHPLASTALEVSEYAQRVATSRAFLEGYVELQDVASQACVDAIADRLSGARVLDFCAGGGGKSLAMAMYEPNSLEAFDANADRMNDIPARADRAGTRIKCIEQPTGSYDLVFCDCPCSGSGAWRRQPEAKWALTKEALDQLNTLQDTILNRAIGHVADGGTLVYATCSIFPAENQVRVETFLKHHSEARLLSSREISPLEGGDGFYVAVMEISASAPETI